MNVFAEEEEDIEMMETDDVCVNYDNNDKDFQNKRKLNSMDERIDVPNIGHKSPQISPNLKLRPFLKARRLLPQMSAIRSQDFCITADQKLKPICVLDTNILLSNLSELKNVILVEEKLRQTTTKSKLKSIIIPWIVVQELDRMKTRKVDKSVINVIHFINEQLKKSNGLMRGENEFLNKLESNSKQTFKMVDEDIDDDRILNSCLKLKTISESNVILISNDINLCNKALMTQLKAINWKEFYDKYKSSDLYFVQTIAEVEDQIEPKYKRLAKNDDKSKIGDKSPTNIRFSLNEKLLNKSNGQPVNTSLSGSAQKPISSISCMKLSSVLSRRLKSPNKPKSSVESPSIRVPKNTDQSINLNSNSTSNECPLNYDDWIRFKDECEQKLLKYIEDTYREIWGNDWQKMLELEINNTNLKEIIRVMRKEWNSNFSDHFNRDKTIKALVDSLHTSLLKWSANYHLYYNDLKHFVQLIESKHNLHINAIKSRKTI